jgi:hypothetical protein
MLTSEGEGSNGAWRNTANFVTIPRAPLSQTSCSETNKWHEQDLSRMSRDGVSVEVVCGTRGGKGNIYHRPVDLWVRESPVLDLGRTRHTYSVSSYTLHLDLFAGPLVVLVVCSGGGWRDCNSIAVADTVCISRFVTAVSVLCCVSDTSAASSFSPLSFSPISFS